MSAGYEKTDPLFVKKFLENLYVDDSLNGANSIEEAYHFYKKSKDCLLKGGLRLESSILIIQVYSRKLIKLKMLLSRFKVRT